MKNKKSKKKYKAKRRKSGSSSNEMTNSLTIHGEISNFKGQVSKIWEAIEKSEERLQDIEIHLNLLTRLLTTLCIEKFGMRIGVLKRLIKRIEKEAIRDSQILHLESLYKLPHQPEKKGQSPSAPSKNDPWEDIS